MADVWNLSVSFDKATYDVGDLMTLTVAGTVVQGGPVPVTATVNILASDGEASVLTANASINPVSLTWGIDSVSDIGGRTWTISGDKTSASAVA